MYICPTCQRQFYEEASVVKHYLACWKKQNPYHKSKNAPQSADVESRRINDELAQFFAQKGQHHD